MVIIVPLVVNAEKDDRLPRDRRRDAGRRGRAEAGHAGDL